MTTSLVSFSALRPVLLAGGLAVAWLAFSAPSGAADTGTDSGSVLGPVSAAAPVNSTASGAAGSVGSGLDTSVPAVTGSALPAAPAPLPPAPTVAHPAPVPGPPQQVSEDSAGPASIPVIALPVANGLDPAETVATAIKTASPVPDVAWPVVEDGAVLDAALQPVTNLATESSGQLGTLSLSPLADVVAPVLDVASPVVDVVSPVLDVASPVLDLASPVAHVVSPGVDVLSRLVDDAAVSDDAALPPVSDLVRDVAPLLVSAPLPGTGDDHRVITLFEGSTADTGTAMGSTGLWSAGALSILTPCGLLTGLMSMLVVPAAAGAGFRAGTGPATGSSGGPMPAPMRASVSASGSGQASGGSQTPAACLSNFTYLALPGSLPVSGLILHLPASVSFDPGSSPD